VIVGTAGHIDHGKTTLVRALTGVDTDRLPEEKARGISIELGYAYVDVPQLAERLGFIDVPGHEKLVHTMLAGASGIDFALLLVAADDGVMPQTREHLAVLSLLGLTRGAVAITKTDRAEPGRVDALTDETRALLAGTGLDAAPILPVCARTGQGVPARRPATPMASRRAWPWTAPSRWTASAPSSRARCMRARSASARNCSWQAAASACAACTRRTGRSSARWPVSAAPWRWPASPGRMRRAAAGSPRPTWPWPRTGSTRACACGPASHGRCARGHVCTCTPVRRA